MGIHLLKLLMWLVQLLLEIAIGIIGRGISGVLGHHHLPVANLIQPPGPS